MLGDCSCFCCRLLNFGHFVIKNYFRNTIRVTNGLDPDEDRRCVDPDLRPDCMQMLSTDDKNVAITERIKYLENWSNAKNFQMRL